MKTNVTFLLIAVIALTCLFASCPLEEITQEVTVSFVVNGGDSPVSSVTLARGKSLGDQYPTPTKSDGSVFMGWFEGVTEYTVDMEINIDLTLTASWLSGDSDSDQLARITFYLDAGVEWDVVTVRTGAAAGPRFPLSPKKQGFVFVKWLDEQGDDFTRLTTVSGNTAVTAQWDTNESTYTVTFVFRSGAGNPTGTPPEPIDVYEGDSIDEWEIQFPSTPELPARPNIYTAYFFIGWADIDNEYYTGSKPITKNVTLYTNVRRALDPPVDMDLDLNAYYREATGWDAFFKPYAISYINGTLTAYFNALDQAIVIPIPAEEQNKVRYGQEFTYTIDGEANPEGKAYRAYIGAVGAANNWNATDTTQEVGFDELSKTVKPGPNVAVANNAKYFIIMARNSNPGWPLHSADNITRVTIRSIRIHIE